MNAELALASVLRVVSSSIDEIPTEVVSEVLDAVADGLETPKHAVHVIVRDDSEAHTGAPSTPVQAATETSDVDTEDAQDADFDSVTSGNINAGDQWKLKDGLRHTDGKAVEWRTVTPDLVGQPVTNYTKSVLRRPKAAFLDLTEGNLAAGDQWKLKDGLRHRDGKAVVWREIDASLVGRPISGFPKSVFRRAI